MRTYLLRQRSSASLAFLHCENDGPRLARSARMRLSLSQSLSRSGWNSTSRRVEGRGFPAEIARQGMQRRRRGDPTRLAKR
jgi:hypothetical protein